VVNNKLMQVYCCERRAWCKETRLWVAYRAGVVSREKKISALALLPICQAELTGHHLLHHSEVTIEKTDGFLVVICSKLAFLSSGGYWSGSQ
jgi:hypothetical protein